jgi:STE24 endopeptidase
MNPLSALYLILLLCVLACRLWLLDRQIRSVRQSRDRVPAGFAGSVPPDAHARASDYTAANARLTMIESALDTLVAALLVWGGALAWVDALWRGTGLSGVALGMAVIVTIVIGSGIIGWPLSAYRVFGIETRFGFNRQTWRGYLADLVKNTLVSAALGLPLLAVVLWLMIDSGPWWWLYAWIVWAAFSLLVSWAYPAFIAPLFNRFQPVQDQALAERIEGLIRRCGFTSRGVFVMDGSRRSAHGNAYFTGLGSNKRIVLFDTLVERLGAAEIEAVLAHELGHFRLHHIRRRLIVSLAGGLIGLAILAWLATQPAFYASLGGAAPSAHIALVLFFLVVPVFSFWLAPIASAWSRRHEFEADRFAMAHADRSDLASALVKLYKDNATTLTPDALYSAFFDSHPPAPVRIARLRATESPAGS